ncbi:amino acid permease 2-like [Vitis riparia]|uniref:amino acid permease 2-like n=1 Tax=Vitis riparia TaxID=96939 RepID=UPI00155A1165|nr:amino acid permease 2-like [Vitis riparia]
MALGDDGVVRTGTFWSTIPHAFTSMVGTCILALPWSISQLGWIVGPVAILAFPVITYYYAALLCDCYRTPDPIKGRRNRTYMDAVRAFLGERNVVICGVLQYAALWGTMIGYTITTAISIASVKRSICFHRHDARCDVQGNLYMMAFGAMEIVLSQFPNLEKVTILSVIATATSFIYSLVALGLSVAKLSTHHELRGSTLVANVGEDIASLTKVWHVFQALGNIAFAYTYSWLLLEIQDTLKSPPPENQVMKKISLYTIAGTSIFYSSLGFIGYAAFGSHAPGNVLTGFGEPFWLVDIGHISVIIHLIGAYQVFGQVVFATNERLLTSRCSTTSVFNRTCNIRFPGIRNGSFQFSLSRLLMRTIFVIFTTLAAMIFPFFNAILSILGSISFWPITVYFPMQMYMIQAKIEKGTPTWTVLYVLSFVCLVVSLVAIVGSVADISQTLRHAKIFHIEL